MHSTSATDRNLESEDLVSVSTSALVLLNALQASVRLVVTRTGFSSNIEANRATSLGDVVIISVITVLLRCTVVALPDLTADTVTRVETIINAEVGSMELDRSCAPLDIPPLELVKGVSIGKAPNNDQSSTIRSVSPIDGQAFGLVSIPVDLVSADRIRSNRGGRRERLARNGGSGDDGGCSTGAGRLDGGSGARSDRGELLGTDGPSGKPTSFGRSSVSSFAQAGIASRYGNVKVICVVPSLLGQSGVACPDLGSARVSAGIVTRIQTEVRPGQLHALLIARADIPKRIPSLAWVGSLNLTTRGRDDSDTVTDSGGGGQALIAVGWAEGDAGCSFERDGGGERDGEGEGGEE